MNTKRIICMTVGLLMAAAAFAQVSGNILGDTLATPISSPKKICVFGDSYVRNHRRPYEETWHFQCAANTGLEYKNYGRNGSCVAFDRTKDGFGPSMLVRYVDIDPNADIVLIIAGHNDAVKVGNDKALLEAFTDSARLLIQKLREHCPKARIGWVTPWFVDQEGFAQVVKAIKKVCKKEHVPVLDNYSKKCVIQVRDADFRKRYFQGANDTAHLNAAGHQLFYPVGLKFLQAIQK